MGSRMRRVSFVVVGIVALVVAGFGLLPAVPGAAAGPIVVTNCKDDGSATTLRVAIANAAPGDTVTFTPGLNCTGANAIVLTAAQGGTLLLTQNVTIDGTGATIVVDGGCTGCAPGGTPSGGVTVFTVNSGATTIIGLTIQHGNAESDTADGGGIENGDTLTLMNVVIRENVAEFGGGIDSVGPLTATNVTISDNTANLQAGGGISAAFAPLTLTNATVSGNTASSTGGGLYIQDTSATLTNVTISGNASTFMNGGGGIRLEAANQSTTATLTNVTVSGNTAPDDPGTGGGIAVNGSTVLNATRTIVSGNSNGDLPSSGINGTNVNNLTGGTPLLAPLGNYGGSTQTRPPLPGSPAIDAGGTGCTGTDQRSLARPVNAACDIGAVESQGFALAKVSGDNQSTGVTTAFANPLVVSVTAKNAGEPVQGGVVTFTGPATGAGIAGSPLTATIGASGQASATITGNGTKGAYSVTASAAGATPAIQFSLTNAPLVSIAVTPANASLKVGGTQQYMAMGTYQDGSTANLTSQVTWSPATGAVVTVDANGNAMAVGPGNATVTATLSGVTGSTGVTVIAPTPVGIQPNPAPASRPGSAGTTTPGGAPKPDPIPPGR